MGVPMQAQESVNANGRQMSFLNGQQQGGNVEHSQGHPKTWEQVCSNVALSTAFVMSLVSCLVLFHLSLCEAEAYLSKAQDRLRVRKKSHVLNLTNVTKTYWKISFLCF